MLNFNKEDNVDRKEDQAHVDPDPDEEEIEDVKLDDERLVPAQDVLFALILWYVAKTLY